MGRDACLVGDVERPTVGPVGVHIDGCVRDDARKTGARVVARLWHGVDGVFRPRPRRKLARVPPMATKRKIRKRARERAS